MPSLRDALATKLPSYAPIAAPPTISVIPMNSFPVTNLRCPLPPFNSDPDTLRQFDNFSIGAKNRVWMPASFSGTVISTAVGTSSFGSTSSSSSSSSSTVLTAKTVVITTGILPAGSSYLTSVQMSESSQLLNLSANAGCEVRLYGTQLAQAFDLSRVTGAPVPPEISTNIISCVTFTSAPFLWPWQSRMATNQDVPQTPAIYVTVLNTVPTSASPVTVTIEYLPLET